jgi:acyl-CoA dehydrogenase
VNDITDALAATVAEACDRYSDADAVAACAGGGWNSRLWTALEQIGVTTVSVPEDRGGAGGDTAAAVAVLEVLGRYAAGVPLAETALLAGWLLAAAGAPVPPGPLTAAVASPQLRLERDGGQWRVTGTLPRVPWARWAGHIAVLAGDQVIVLRPDDVRVTEGVNLAGEPRDDVSADGLVPDTAVFPVPAAITAAAFGQRAALARAALMAGAARRALELSVAYAGEREQFGRPIGRFQAVQQHLAAMAGEVLLARVAAGAAACAVDASADGRGAGAGDAGAEVAVAAAKAVAGQAAGQVTALAHQVHGAIGFTEEHPLRHSTTRLWAWRDEDGNEQRWSAVLGQRALEAGSSGLWPLVSGSTTAG